MNRVIGLALILGYFNLSIQEVDQTNPSTQPQQKQNARKPLTFRFALFNSFFLSLHNFAIHTSLLSSLHVTPNARPQACTSSCTGPTGTRARTHTHNVNWKNMHYCGARSRALSLNLLHKMKRKPDSDPAPGRCAPLHVTYPAGPRPPASSSPTATKGTDTTNGSC